MSAFNGSAGKNHLQERQFWLCQVILLKLDSELSVDMTALNPPELIKLELENTHESRFHPILEGSSLSDPNDK